MAIGCSENQNTSTYSFIRFSLARFSYAAAAIQRTFWSMRSSHGYGMNISGIVEDLRAEKQCSLLR